MIARHDCRAKNDRHVRIAPKNTHGASAGPRTPPDLASWRGTRAKHAHRHAHFRASLAVSPLAESGGHSLIPATPFYLRHHPPRSDPSELSRHPQFRVRCGAGLRAPVVAPLASHLCPAVNCVRRTWAGPSTCFAFGAAVRTSLSSPRQSLSNMQENSRLEKRHPLASRPASRPGYVLTCARRSAPQV